MGRAPCCDKNGLKKGPWTTEEDQKLVDYIQEHGYGNWRTLPKNAGTWSAIASRLPGRTDNEIKNYWNTHIRKRLLRMGIDPVTHSPRLDLLDISSLLNASFYASSQMPLGMQQPLMNPDLLRLASSHQHKGPDPHFVQVHDPCSTPCVSCPLTQQQLVELHNVDPYTSSTSTFTDFSYQQHSHDDQITVWHKDGISLSTSTDEYIPQLSSYNYSSFDTQHLVYPYQPSTFHSNNSNQNFNLASVLSTPSSSPTPLNSNSTIINGSITEDEKDQSYDSSSMLTFEIPDIFYMNEFIVEGGSLEIEMKKNIKVKKKLILGKEKEEVGDMRTGEVSGGNGTAEKGLRACSNVSMIELKSYALAELHLHGSTPILASKALKDKKPSPTLDTTIFVYMSFCVWNCSSTWARLCITGNCLYMVSVACSESVIILTIRCIYAS
ncbi:hypothetical protein VNO78_03715 [Psophocarpus tetragonolobus]|uniref:Uncharacterized protein n=1 Tax=Psophocarpus tetragonolobus TaxID=3891 RepID=A0AAN9T1J5_PSOTE